MTLRTKTITMQYCLYVYSYKFIQMIPKVKLTTILSKKVVLFVPPKQLITYNNNIIIAYG